MRTSIAQQTVFTVILPMTEADLNSGPFTHRQTQTAVAASASMADCQYWLVCWQIPSGGRQ